jgi:1-hydroxy-2-methyl-2-(E)-butenyl 4-diphosphate synthase
MTRAAFPWAAWPRNSSREICRGGGHRNPHRPRPPSGTARRHRRRQRDFHPIPRGLADAGCEIVRVTAQTKVYAANLENIVREVRAAGCEVPIVADIHFKPDAALEAAKWVEKVRVNPGNYVDKKKFEIREYTDDQYEEELQRIRDQFTPLVRLCRELGRAMRIGTNHGSLSDRIMNRYGDTPLGMVESALEFARIARENGYHELIFSMKASNPKVMIEAYRLLVARLDAEGPDWNYPIHLGVTEAGDGEDGRIKSAIGIGSLLADGIGDTIRVSLTEDSVHEIPVARALVEPYNCGWGVSPQAVEGASRPSLQQDAESIRPDWDQLEKRDSTFLPHWRIPGATYVVTFRLADSLPESALADYHRRKEILMERLHELSSQGGSRSSLQKLVALRSEIAGFQDTFLDAALNQCHGECHLKNPEIAGLVEGALQHFDGERYTLFAWSVMPNHVHVMLRPEGKHELEDIVQAWKSFSAKKANELLGRSGTFWQAEYYDHLVRDADDFRRQVRYLLENPNKGNVSARWTGTRYVSDAGARRPGDGLGRDAPATIAFVPHLGSLLCDGIGDAVLVRANPRPASRCGSPTTSCRPPAPASSRPTTSPARAAAAPCSTCSHHPEDPRRHRPPQGRAHRRHGLHRQRPGRNGRRRLRLRRRRAGQDQPLRRQDRR